MTIILGLMAITTATLLVFSDKIIGYYIPEGGIAQLSDEVDDVIVMIDDQNDQLMQEQK